MLILLTLSSFAVSTLSSQQRGVDFRDDYWLEKAIQIAQLEDKNIFIDTYAPWCGPCKLMDIQFQDHDLGVYFNENYINVRINMDSPYGEAVRTKYDVFFLPTLLILDKYGNAKYTSEGTVTSDELLAIGSYHHNAIYKPEELASINEVNESSKATTTAQVSAKKTRKPKSNRPSKEAEKEEAKLSQLPSADMPINLPPNEKILYTEDQAAKDPSYLYNLTYLKLQLQDGSQWQAAADYLKTQEDWSSEKNMRFIYDFVRKPGSELFQHIIENRSSYNELFSEESVDRSISIMVNLALYQGYPRPEKEEALKLFSILDAEVAHMATYNYMLARYEEEERYSDYVSLALDYVTNHDQGNFLIIEKIAEFYEDSGTEVNIEDVIKLTKDAIEFQGGSYYKLYDVLANLYYQNNNKRKALSAIKTAKELAIASNLNTDSIERLQERIEKL